MAGRESSMWERGREVVIYGSVCSGIEAASAAWHPLGWKPAWFAEIEPFPCAVLAHYYPGVTNHGDFTKITAAQAGSIDLLVGGTPCQSFSVAGKRGGLDDARGNLTLEFLKLVGRVLPRWVVWENVPGVLSIDGGRTFGTFIGAMGELGYGVAYRILNAQFFGVPQRRRRVFVVGCLGDWRRAAAVLFERESMCRNSEKGGKTEAEVSATVRGGSADGGGPNGKQYEGTLIAATVGASHPGRRNGGSNPTPGTLVAVTLRGNSGANQIESQYVVAHTLRGGGMDASEDGTGRGTPLVFQPGGDSKQVVRRLTPRECERLQGFPDDHTLVPYRGKPATDTPRYKAIGNSMAVPCMRWIGERIQVVEDAGVGA